MPLTNETTDAMTSLFFGKSTTSKNNEDAIVLARRQREQAYEDQFNQIAALNRSMAVIEFDLEGYVLTANQNFLDTMGYTLQEIQGKHHRIFVGDRQANSNEYQRLWRNLREGQFSSGEFLRFGKGGVEIWIQGSYHPVLSSDGSVLKVVKFATNISDRKAEEASIRSQINAMSRSSAVIEFELDGTIVNANENFLSLLGYNLTEVQGKNHSMFVDDSTRRSPEYREFWTKLNRGDYQVGVFSRITKSGREVWIQASYNPMFDANGRISRVIKYATDISKAHEARAQTSRVSDAISESVAQFSQTITEISSNVNRTASLSSEAKEIASSTCDAVKNLDQSSRDIGKIVEVIQELADQTNLLALNATIESARAGEAGRGFAVVASAVKDLAKQTASATKNIEMSVRDIQHNIAGVVNSTETISKSVSEVSVNMTTIAAAVEEQSVTMSSISRTADELRSIRMNEA
jgi:methyl-accepting chemotaxis protein